MKMRKFYLMMLALILAVTMGIPSFAEDGMPETPAEGENIAADGDTDATEPSDDGDVTEPSDDGDVTEPSDDEDVTEPSGDGDVTEPSGDGDATEPSEDGDVTEPSEDGDVTEPSEDGEEQPTVGSSELEQKVQPPKRVTLVERAPSTIDVSVPGSGKVFINPCRLPVSLEGGPKSTDQIVSKTMYIRNRSSSPVIMNVTVQGIIGAGSDIRLVVDKPDSDATRKDLFLYAEFKPTLDDIEPVWDPRFGDRDYQLTVTSTSRRRSEVLTLAAAGKEKSCAAMRLFGATVMQPKIPWTANDKVEVNFTFEFKPV